MGEVHLARSLGAAGFEKLVALKVLDPRFQDDPELTRSLLREAFLGVHLDHPNLVSILDLGEENRRWFIAMEYVRGYSLAQAMSHVRRRGRVLPVATAFHVGRAIADALVYLHGLPKGLVHGDVSPSNLVLSQDGRVKLTDFGVASLAGEPARRHGIAGKRGYLPPEAWNGAAREPGWDVYALGVVLWEILAGRPRVSEDAQGEKRPPEILPSLLPLRPEAPPALLAVVERAAAVKREHRFASAKELAVALAGIPFPADSGHAEAVSALFADASFVETHGPLPKSGDLSPLAAVDAAVNDPRQGTQTFSPRGDRVLRLALSPAMGAQPAREASERLAASLSAALGREVRPLVVADYQGLVDCLVAGDVDLAWTPPAAFVSALERGAGGLVALKRAGRTFYESAIIVRADCPMTELAEVDATSLAWVEPSSSAGYLFALALLHKTLGRAPRGSQHFHGSHRAVCHAVLRGWATAGATYASRDAEGSVVSSAWQEHLGGDAGAIRPLAFSLPIPGDTLAFRPQLPGALAAELVVALERWAEGDEGRGILGEIFRAEGVERVDLAAYASVQTALAAARGCGVG
jgi:serine/threonine-protein kinase